MEVAAPSTPAHKHDLFRRVVGARNALLLRHRLGLALRLTFDTAHETNASRHIDFVASRLCPYRARTTRIDFAVRARVATRRRSHSDQTQSDPEDDETKKSTRIYRSTRHDVWAGGVDPPACVTVGTCRLGFLQRLCCCIIQPVHGGGSRGLKVEEHSPVALGFCLFPGLVAYVRYHPPPRVRCSCRRSTCGQGGAYVLYCGQQLPKGSVQGH